MANDNIYPDLTNSKYDIGYTKAIVTPSDILPRSVLNLEVKAPIASTTDVEITDGGSYIVTADSGLHTNTSTNVQLGGILLDNTIIDLDTYSLAITNLTNLSTQDRLLGQDSTTNELGYITLGANLSFVAGVLSATATSGIDTVLAVGQSLTANRSIINNGFNLTVANNSASTTLSATNSSNGPAIVGSATSGIGVWAISSSSLGLQVNSTTGQAAYFAVNPTSTNTVVPILTVTRSTSGVVGNGIGGSIDFVIQNNGESPTLTKTSTRLISIWTDAILATRTSTFEIWGTNLGTSFKKADLNSTSGFTVYSTQSQPTTTAELNISPDGWTITGAYVSSGSGRYTLPAFGSGTISYDFGTLTIGDVYVFVFNSNVLTGATNFSFGGYTTTQNPGGSAAGWRHINAKVTTTSGILTLTTTSTSSGSGWIESITLKKILAATPISFANNTEDGNNELEIRSDFRTANIGIGYQAGQYSINQITTSTTVFGTRNIAIGHQAMRLNTVGGDSIAIGYQAMYNTTEADYCIAIGSSALYSVVTGGFLSINNAIGFEALRNCTTGYYNTAYGYQSLRAVTTGSYNTGVGGVGNISGITSGSYNVGVGYSVFQSVSTGSYNVGVGSVIAQSATTSASLNIGIGIFCLNGLSTGQGNIGIGYQSMTYVSTGNYNLSVGTHAGYAANFNAAYEISSNRSFASDTRNIFIGYDTSRDFGTSIVMDNSIAIGSSAKVYQSHQVTLGGNEITSTFLKGVVETRDFSVLATNIIADPTIPGGTTKWGVTGGVTLGTNKAIFDLNSSATGTLVQTAANLTTAGKAFRWYKMSMTLNTLNTGAPNFWPSYFNVNLTGSTFANQTRLIRDTTFGGGGTFFMYFKSIGSPTDITLSFSGNISSGPGILEITNVSVQECLGGDLYANRYIKTYAGAVVLESNFTPASSTDTAHPIGTITSDDTYLWRRGLDGTWRKLAFASF